MKWLMIGLLVLVISVAVAVFTLPDPGYVLIGYGKYSVETSLLVLVTVLVVAYLVLRLLASLWRAPRRVRRWEVERGHRRLRTLFNEAVIELADGRVESAERRLFRLTSWVDAPLDIFLSAARAANRLEADERRDIVLKRALRRFPGAELAVALVEAELQLSRSQVEQARTTLTHLQSVAPDNRQVLRLLMHLHARLNEWSELRRLLPALKQHHVLDAEKWRKLAIEVYREQLLEYSSVSDADALTDEWKKFPATVRTDSSLLTRYIEQLVRLGLPGKAEKLLRDQINSGWDQNLVYLYGDLITEDMAARQNVAEQWLAEHPQDPSLLLSLGKISLRNSLWGKAQGYFEAAIAQHASPEAYRLLGMLLEQLGDMKRAAECYRLGAGLNDQSGLLRLHESASGERLKEPINSLGHIAGE